jgi:hypothetical protein
MVLSAVAVLAEQSWLSELESSSSEAMSVRGRIEWPLEATRVLFSWLRELASIISEAMSVSWTTRGVKRLPEARLVRFSTLGEPESSASATSVEISA